MYLFKSEYVNKSTSKPTFTLNRWLLTVTEGNTDFKPVTFYSDSKGKNNSLNAVCLVVKQVTYIKIII